MDQMTHEVQVQEADPHAGHKMSMAQGNHDRHAGHSVAMFRDKFWLSFGLTIPVVFWSADVMQPFGASGNEVRRNGRHEETRTPDLYRVKVAL